MTEEWLYVDENDIQSAKRRFDQLGFCCFTRLLDDIEIETLIAGVENALTNGAFIIDDSTVAANNDAIYASEDIERICKHPVLVRIAKIIIGHDIELQHAKFNAKPITDRGVGEVPWHQDFPFYPHTNYDLVSCVIHLDDEFLGSGQMEFIPGTHKLGPVSHVDENGNFAYECTDTKAISSTEPRVLLAKRGWVAFHHGLVLHRSAPNSSGLNRRLLVFQYRAVDAIQLAGVVWKCNGYQVESLPIRPRIARFPCGTEIELRGKNGRLYDIHNILAPTN